MSQGRAYFESEEGGTVVVEPGEEMKIVAKSKLPSESDELFRASLVPCQGQIFIRSNKFLNYFIGFWRTRWNTAWSSRNVAISN